MSRDGYTSGSEEESVESDQSSAILESGGRKFVVVWQGIVYHKKKPADWDAEIVRVVTIIQKTIDKLPSLRIQTGN